jgi:predicted transcriptional regulator
MSDITAAPDGEANMSEQSTLNAVELATELTIAWLGNQNNRVAAEEVPSFLRAVHATVTQLAAGSASSGAEGATQASTFTPAVSVGKSLASKDHIISMIDGKPYKMLRRHLSRHGLTPEQYRERYDLRPDYPMVAESYSATRSAMAHKIGLGRRRREANAATADVPSAKREKPTSRRAAKSA